jgi:hypothetical protein
MNIEWNDIRDSIPPEGQKVVFYYRESEYSRHWISFLGVYGGNKWEREICHHDGCFWAMPPSL